MEKIEKLLKVIEEGKEKERKDIEALMKEEHERRMELLEKEYREKEEKLKGEVEEEIEKLKKIFESEKESILMRERVMLKVEIVRSLREAMMELLMSDSDLRKRAVRKLYEMATADLKGSYVVKCAKEDYETLKDLARNVEVDEELEFGVVVESENKRMRIVAGMEEIFEMVENELGRIADEKAGGLA